MNLHMNVYIIIYINILYCTRMLLKICTLLCTLVYGDNVHIVRIVHIATNLAFMYVLYTNVYTNAKGWIADVQDN